MGPVTQWERASTSVDSRAVMMASLVDYSITPAGVTGRLRLAAVRHPSPGVLSFRQKLRGEDVR